MAENPEHGRHPVYSGSAGTDSVAAKLDLIIFTEEVIFLPALVNRIIYLFIYVCEQDSSRSYQWILIFAQPD